jgi:hypothetical protein
LRDHGKQLFVVLFLEVLLRYLEGLNSLALLLWSAGLSIRRKGAPKAPWTN